MRLLAIAMPLTIASVAALGWGLAGMTIAGAITLGAVLAPTDPVLAGDVQVGPPQSGQEHPVRFTLTTEAGLNDGLAFPFVYLGLAIAADGLAPEAWLWEWLVLDLLYRVLVGLLGGYAIGRILGRMSFARGSDGAFGDSAPGVIALAGTLLCYGLVELIEGYGFLAAFCAGVAFRRADHEHRFHHRLHEFSEAIEQAVSFLGVRGIGSVYYIAYASGHIEFVNKAELWALVAYTVFASALIHGSSARITMRYTDVPR